MADLKQTADGEHRADGTCADAMNCQKAIETSRLLRRQMRNIKRTVIAWHRQVVPGHPVGPAPSSHAASW